MWGCWEALRVSDGAGILAGRGEAGAPTSPLLAETVGDIWDTASPALGRSGERVDKNWSSVSWLFISASETQDCILNTTVMQDYAKKTQQNQIPFDSLNKVH